MKKLIPLLLLAVMFTAGCDLSGISLTTTNQPPLINSFAANPPSIAAGESSTLSWGVTGATTVSIDQGIGTVALSGSRAVMPSVTTIYKLTATNAAGLSGTATAQVMVTSATPSSTTPPSPTPSPSSGLPVVNYFTASPSSIYAGDSTILSWSVSNATSVTIDHGVGVVGLSGSVSVSPSTSTDYILTATNAAGWWTKGTIVLVSGVSLPSSSSVTSVYASAEPPFFTGACPTNFYSEAVITVNGPGTVTYNWERSDGALSRIASLTFDEPGSQIVNVSWSLDETGSYWARVHVFTPNEIISNQASFTLSCAGTEILNWTGTWQITSAQSPWGSTISFYQTGNQVTGSYPQHENGMFSGTVSGNILTGTWSEEPTYLPPNDAGDLQITMSPDGNTFNGEWRYDSSGSWYDFSGQRIP